MTKEGYQKNKYLDDLGLSITEYGTNFVDNTDKRWEKWQKEKEEYGFDSRECWDLDSIFVEWIYSHFMKYKDDCNVDLSFHKFSYRKDKNSQYTEITQGEGIDIVCEACAEFLKTDDFDREFLDDEIMLLIGHLMPAMWW